MKEEQIIIIKKINDINKQFKSDRSSCLKHILLLFNCYFLTASVFFFSVSSSFFFASFLHIYTQTHTHKTDAGFAATFNLQLLALAYASHAIHTLDNHLFFFSLCTNLKYLFFSHLFWIFLFKESYFFIACKSVCQWNCISPLYSIQTKDLMAHVINSTLFLFNIKSISFSYLLACVRSANKSSTWQIIIVSFFFNHFFFLEWMTTRENV